MWADSSMFGQWIKGEGPQERDICPPFSQLRTGSSFGSVFRNQDLII